MYQKLIFLVKRSLNFLKLNRLFYHLFSILYRNKSYVKPSEPRLLLNNYSPCPDGTVLADNNISKQFNYDLQIIVPAYNVEKHIKQCVDSILNQQTQYSYHLVIIDDGSTDETGHILDLYDDHPNVHIIHQKNKGFSGARNTGLKNITAEYITFIDSDDYLPEGALQSLMYVAKNKNADIVEGEYYTLKSDKLSPSKKVEKIHTVAPYGHLRGQPWGKVFRSSLFEHICFPEGFWFEDSINSFLLYPLAKSRYVIPEYVYVYRINPEGISQTYSNIPKCVDTYWITEMLMAEHKNMGFTVNSEYYDKVLRQIILNVKRTNKMPENIKKSIFCLHSCLIKKYFTDENIKPSVHKDLQKAIFNEDYYAYLFYCIAN